MDLLQGHMKMGTWTFVENVLKRQPSENWRHWVEFNPMKIWHSMEKIMEWVLLLNLICSTQQVRVQRIDLGPRCYCLLTPGNHIVVCFFYFILEMCPETLFSFIKDGMLNYYLNQYYILASDLRVCMHMYICKCTYTESLLFSTLSSNNTICCPSANIFTIMPLFLRSIIQLSLWLQQASNAHAPHHQHLAIFIFEQSLNWLQIWFF